MFFGNLCQPISILPSLNLKTQTPRLLANLSVHALLFPKQNGRNYEKFSTFTKLLKFSKRFV
jgi:hypothetical protein